MVEDESKPDLLQDTPRPSGGKAPAVELKGLIQLARTAYDQKRRKECLALSNAILKIDPASGEARVLRSLIESDIQQALQRINALVKNPRMKNDEALRTNAYQLLQSVLEIDPDNKAANALLPEVGPGAARDPSAGTSEPKVRPENEKRSERPGWTPPEVGPPESFPIHNGRRRNSWVRYAALIAIVLVIAAIAVHFGLVATVLEWFGISNARKSPPTGSLSWIVNAAEQIALHQPLPESFF